MPSIIEGYNYDIFISYRQKDNKGDRWVSRFVDALKTELEATFKEDVSVYFDENPHDRLQETYDVDKSLEGKLKCLIFIPILSQTYCDPNSYAWQHEFLAFLQMVKNDRFGKDVRLRSGNVASRILPIRIHDLEPEDVKLYEKETGSVLRAMDFVFKTGTGAIRPLLPNEDHPNDNLYKTFYRDQISKVAIAIKEIVLGMKAVLSEEEKEKTESAFTSDEVIRKEEAEKVSKSVQGKLFNIRTISVAITALVLIIICILFIPKLFKPEEQLEKSIAVLPFFNDSPDEENTHFINGIMDEILNNLQVIKDLRVVSRSSVEQYRGTARPAIPKIAKQLGVNYIVEGSGQKYGNSIRLRVQLIEAVSDKHLWAESYEQEIKETKDIFDLQSQIAESIASELKAIIAPEEKNLIEKLATTSLTAYDFYLRGKTEQSKYNEYNTSTRAALDRADEFYKKALEYDPSFAQAYVGMAQVYRHKHYWETYLSENFIDSVLILVNKALSIDDKLAEAYTTRASYYQQKGSVNKAFEDCNKALRFNPNDYYAYYLIGFFSIWNFEDYAKSIDNMHKAVLRNRGAELPEYLRTLARYYQQIGFIDKAKYYYQEAYSLHRDSSKYLYDLAIIEYTRENFKEALVLFKEAKEIDSTRSILFEVYYFLPSNYYEEAYQLALKRIESYKKAGILPIWQFHRFAHAFWRVGKKKEAEYYFNQQIKYDEESIKLGRSKAIRGDSYFDLAVVYAFLGEKGKAYEYLDEFNKKKKMLAHWWIIFFRHDPLLDSLRGEERFQQIVSELEAKYQAEHERVRKWLEENNML